MPRASNRVGLFDAIKLDCTLERPLTKLARKRKSPNPQFRMAAAWICHSLRLTMLGWQRLARQFDGNPSAILQAISIGLGRRPLIAYRQSTMSDVTNGISQNDRRRITNAVRALRSNADRGTNMIEALGREPRLSALTWIDLLFDLHGTSNTAQVLRAWGSRHLLE